MKDFYSVNAAASLSCDFLSFCATCYFPLCSYYLEQPEQIRSEVDEFWLRNLNVHWNDDEIEIIDQIYERWQRGGSDTSSFHSSFII